MRRTNYERDDEKWPGDAYRVRGHEGVLFRVRGWETAPDEDTEWSGYEPRTGRVVVVMVGDDHRWIVDEDDILDLVEEDDVCACGQDGCGWH